MFPFYYWLPEVHCEANTSISLVLAGLLLKLSLFGLSRYIIITFNLWLFFILTLIISISLIGLLLINYSFFRFIDLKKIIAFSSIIHLNTILTSLSSSNTIGLLSLFTILLSHSLSSIGLFFIIGLIIDKTYLRYIDSFYLIGIIIILIYFFTLLMNLNFPGSINFITELLILIAIYSIIYFIIPFLLLFSFIESFIYFIDINKKIPFHSCFSLVIISYWVYLLLFLHLLFHSLIS